MPLLFSVPSKYTDNKATEKQIEKKMLLFKDKTTGYINPTKKISVVLSFYLLGNFIRSINKIYFPG